MLVKLNVNKNITNDRIVNEQYDGRFNNLYIVNVVYFIS